MIKKIRFELPFRIFGFNNIDFSAKLFSGWFVRKCIYKYMSYGMHTYRYRDNIIILSPLQTTTTLHIRDELCESLSGVYGVPFKCEGYGTSMKCLGLHICVDMFYMSHNDGKVFSWCGLHNESECLQCLCGVDPQILKTVYSQMRNINMLRGRQNNTSSHCVQTQHNTTLHNTSRHNTTLHYTAQQKTRHKSTQHYTTLQNTSPHHTAIHSTTQHNTTLHNTMWHNTTLQKTTSKFTHTSLHTSQIHTHIQLQQ